MHCSVTLFSSPCELARVQRSQLVPHHQSVSRMTPTPLQILQLELTNVASHLTQFVSISFLVSKDTATSTARRWMVARRSDWCSPPDDGRRGTLPSSPHRSLRAASRKLCVVRLETIGDCTGRRHRRADYETRCLAYCSRFQGCGGHLARVCGTRARALWT